MRLQEVVWLQLCAKDTRADNACVLDLNPRRESLRDPHPDEQALLGEDASADQTDSHTKAYMENPDAFVGIKPEVYGNKRKLILGVKTGRTTLEYKLRELKLDVPPEKYPEILKRLQALSLKNKGRALSDADVIKLIPEP